jgi:DNA-directed RNA polymerase specialized sigma24 family protein
LGEFALQSVDPAIGDALIAALRAGGTEARDAVEFLYRQYAGRPRTYSQRHGAGAAQAEDWVQDRFVRVLRGAQGLRGDSAPFPAWLWKLSRNTMLEAWRQDRGPHLDIDDADEALAVADPGADPERYAASRSLEHGVRRGFRELWMAYPERAQCLSWIAYSLE